MIGGFLSRVHKVGSEINPLTTPGSCCLPALLKLDGVGPVNHYVVFAHWMLSCPVGYVERGGALPPVTGLTDQRIICC